MEGVDPIDLELGPDLATEEGTLLQREHVQARSRGSLSDHNGDSDMAESRPLLPASASAEEGSTLDDRPAPLWRRVFRRPKPSPYLLLPLFFLVAVNLGACIAPRIQIYTELVCRDFYHRDQMRQRNDLINSVFNWTYAGPVAPAYLSTEPLSSAADSWVDASLGHPVGSLNLAYSAFTTRVNSLSGMLKQGSAGISSTPVEIPSPAFCRMPKVQSQVTKLALTLTLLSGILGSLTTSRWSSLSDIKGRVWVIKFGVWGSISTDIVLLLVVYFAPVVNGYWLLTVGAMLDGMFGSFTAASAAFHAYISDCIPARDRVSFFSIMIATFFIGLAIGPTLGAYIIDFAGDIMIVFWIAVFFHLTFFFIANFILPESLSAETREKVAQKREESRRAKASASTEQVPSRETKVLVRFSAVLQSVGASIHEGAKPALEFLPRTMGEQGTRLYDLFFISIVFVILFLMMGLYSINLIYVSGQFGWNTLEQGYFVSGMSALRVFHLLVILPAVIRLFKPKESTKPETQAVENEESPQYTGVRRIMSVLNLQGYRRLRHKNYGTLPPAPRGAETISEENSGHGTGTPTVPNEETPDKTGFVQATEAELHFDLYLARTSILIEMAGYVLMANATSGRCFVIGAMILTFSSAASPAVQSLALAFSDKHSTGKLMAGLSLLQGLSGIMAPLLFGGVYSFSVGTWPSLVYHVAWFLLLIAAVLLFCVKLRHKDVLERRQSFSR